MIALKSIRFYQKFGYSLLPQREFQELVQEIGKQYFQQFCCTQSANLLAQEAIEMRLVTWAKEAVEVACVTRKSKIVTLADFIATKK